MLKYKRVDVTGLKTGIETIIDMIAGMAGKSRRIVSIGTEYAAIGYLRVYRDAEQIVDYDLTKITATFPMLKMDLPLAEGQQCKVGIYGKGVTDNATGSCEITIGYEETG